MHISRVLAIHGIHDDGDAGIDVMAAMLANVLGVPFHAPELPRRWAVTDYLPGPVEHDAALVRQHVRSTTVALAHSRGALTLHHAMLGAEGRMPTSLGVAFLFAPALPPATLLGGGCFRRAYIIHNRHDRALRWSRLLPWHPYANWLGGSMGRDGYTGPSIRVTNVPTHERTSFLSHSYWRDDQCEQWVAYMAKKLKEPMR